MHANGAGPPSAPREKRVTVAVRVRPLSARERQCGSSRVVGLAFKRVIVSDPVEVAHGGGGDPSAWSREFGFDAVFGDGGSAADQQDDVYRALGLPVLAHAWTGFNSSIFAYGQTGSGKTHSMLGDDPTASPASAPERGLIPRVCCGLFDAADAHAAAYETAIEASYMEVYNETVRDLLLPTGKALRVREHPRDGACVPDLTLVRVCSREELVALLQVGSKSRATAATRGNARSSRSHAVFTLSLSRRKRRSGSEDGDGESAAPAAAAGDGDAWWAGLDLAAMPSSSKATIRLVDLAGSERVAVAGRVGINRWPGISSNSSTSLKSNSFSMILEPSIRSFPSSRRLERKLIWNRVVGILKSLFPS